MFAGVGERTREGNDLYKEMIESVCTLGLQKAAQYLACKCMLSGHEQLRDMLGQTNRWHAPSGMQAA